MFGVFIWVDGVEGCVGCGCAVVDWLFKICNSLNFEGVFCRLLFFDLSIDLVMLVWVVVFGVDVFVVFSGFSQLLFLVWFCILVVWVVEMV